MPIVALVFLLAFFTWLATYRAVENDRRMEEGLPPLEKLDDEKVLVWPDLVYTEMICMIALSALLIFWAIWLQAPLEEPASSVKTPNPSKAPWYFLGLQEMLVYYDPWMAGVVLPSLIIVGLMAIPYIDFNKRGNGYYTIKERHFAYITFQLGFLELWVTLIVLGTLLRGPNWNFFGPYESWDAHKVEALDERQPVGILLAGLAGNARCPRRRRTAGFVTQLRLHPAARMRPASCWCSAISSRCRRSWPSPCSAASTSGWASSATWCWPTCCCSWLSLPIKMVLRWTFNLKYLIAIPEYFLNF